MAGRNGAYGIVEKREVSSGGPSLGFFVGWGWDWELESSFGRFLTIIIHFQNVIDNWKFIPTPYCEKLFFNQFAVFF